MDSLLATRLRAFLVQLLRRASPSESIEVPGNVVYDNPSVSALVTFVLSTLSSSKASPADSDVKSRVQQSVQRFTTKLVHRSVPPNVANGVDRREYVIVTGTTGSLGTFLLDQLLDRLAVNRIYCF